MNTKADMKLLSLALLPSDKKHFYATTDMVSHKRTCDYIALLFIFSFLTQNTFIVYKNILKHLLQMCCDES